MSVNKSINLYNTKTKKIEEFSPLGEKVRMYVCGPTVYSEPHLGNALSIVVYDLLYRLLVYKYGKDKVIYVRNITDVDDKINNTAKEKNIPISVLTKEITDIFHQDINKLSCIAPTQEPKATEHIAEMIEIIQRLIDLDHAYIADNHVFFSVHSDPNYGQISGRKIDEMIAGARVAVQDIKKSPEDFVLWKPAQADDPEGSTFESPWGTGRPGWHIECSAMSSKYLGNDFDIHGGGLDLLFPHHTNEIAQSCCAYPGSKFANFWVHNGFLTVDNEKMSKSLGNFITLRDVLNKGYHGEIIRFVLMSSHYRSKVNFSYNNLEEAKTILDGFYRLLQQYEATEEKVNDQFLDSLFNDLNMPEAMAVMHELSKKANTESNPLIKNQIIAGIKASMQLIGLLQESPEKWFHGNIDENFKKEIENLIDQRIEAKKEKNFALADEIRTKLLKKNILLEDKKDGTTDWKIQ